MPADQSLVLEALRRGLITPGQAQTQLGIAPGDTGIAPDANRLVKDIGAGAQGVEAAGRNFLGMIGSAAKILDPNSDLPTLENIGDVSSNAADFLNKQYNLGLPTSLTSPDTPEAKYIKAGTEGAAGMATDSLPLMALGGVAGVAGEGAANLGKGDTSTIPGTNDSVMRTLAQLGILLPTTFAAGFRAPGAVRELGDTLESLVPGGTAQDVRNTIDLANSRASAANNALWTDNTPVWAQFNQPSDMQGANQLLGKVTALRALPQGAPLNEQAANTVSAIDAATQPGAGTIISKSWTPNGYQGTASVVGNLIDALTKTAPEMSTGVSPGVGLISSIAKNLNPFKAFETAGNWLQGTTKNQILGGIARALASPGAADYLKSITTYSPTQNAIQNVLQTVGRLGLMGDQGE